MSLIYNARMLLATAIASVYFYPVPAVAQVTSKERGALVDRISSRCNRTDLSIHERTVYCEYANQLYTMILKIHAVPNTRFDASKTFLEDGDKFLSQCASENLTFESRDTFCNAAIASYKAEITRRAAGMMNQ